MSELGKAFREAVEGTDPLAIYKRTHGATVRAQNDDDTVELDCETPELGHVPRVPLRVGIPTARVLVEEGTSVRLAYENGDPEKPYAFGLDADADADKGIARVGDLVDIGLLTYAGPGSLTWTHPDPTHIPPQQVGTIQLQGIIVSGSGKVKLRGDE